MIEPLINNKVDPVDAEASNRMETLKKLSGKSILDMSEDEKKEIAEASRGFEAMFVHMMLKEMKSAMLGEFKDDESSVYFGADTLSSYSDLLFAEEVSKKSGGIGIAEMLYSQLTGGDKLNNITYEFNEAAVPLLNIGKNENATLNSANKKEKTSSGAKNIIEEFGYIQAQNTTAAVKGAFMDRVKNRLSGYQEIIEAASEKFNLPESLIKSVITAESAGKCDAKSHAGAKGLMQLMDGTADSLGVTNSYDPFENIMGGSKYLRKMLDRFDGNLELALAGYNAGPGNVEKYGGIPPFKETQAYVKKVINYMEKY